MPGTYCCVSQCTNWGVINAHLQAMYHYHATSYKHVLRYVRITTQARESSEQ